MNKQYNYREKTTHLLIALCSSLSLLLGGGLVHAAQPTSSAANSAEELFYQMMDAEYGVYKEAEQEALEIRLMAYKYYMDQSLDTSLEDSTPHLKMLHHITELYGRLLKLRVENIIETKRRWPNESVDEQIDMLAYQPRLLTDMMDNLDWMITMDALGLNWEQETLIRDSSHRRDMVRRENKHQVELRLIDMKKTLSENIPDPDWVDESVDEVVALYDEIINEYKLNYNNTWELLSPEQRAMLREMTFASFRSQ